MTYKRQDKAFAEKLAKRADEIRWQKRTEKLVSIIEGLIAERSAANMDCWLCGPVEFKRAVMTRFANEKGHLDDVDHGRK